VKIFALILFFISIIITKSFADSDSYGCYGNGVIAFDEAFKDPTGLYIILWGEKSRISKKFRIELPRRHGPYSQGIKCEKNKVSIYTRGVPPESNTKEITKYKMHLTEISLKDRSNPKIISDKPNHYQIWLNYTRQEPEPLNDKIPILLIPEPNLNLKSCRKNEIKLESDDPNHTYHLLFNNSKTTSTVKNGYGSIFHRCETLLVMKNENAEIIQKAQIANTESEETID